MNCDHKNTIEYIDDNNKYNVICTNCIEEVIIKKNCLLTNTHSSDDGDHYRHHHHQRRKRNKTRKIKVNPN